LARLLRRHALWIIELEVHVRKMPWPTCRPSRFSGTPFDHVLRIGRADQVDGVAINKEWQPWIVGNRAVVDDMKVWGSTALRHITIGTRPILQQTARVRPVPMPHGALRGASLDEAR